MAFHDAMKVDFNSMNECNLCIHSVGKKKGDYCIYSNRYIGIGNCILFKSRDELKGIDDFGNASEKCLASL